MGSILLVFGCANLCRAGVCVKKGDLILSAVFCFVSLAGLLAGAIYAIIS